MIGMKERDTGSGASSRSVTDLHGTGRPTPADGADDASAAQRDARAPHTRQRFGADAIATINDPRHGGVANASLSRYFA